MFQKILVAVTPSQENDPAVNEAIALAQLTQARLMLLHVLSPMDEGYPTPVYPIHDSVYPTMHDEAIKTYTIQWQAYEQESLSLLQHLAQKADTIGVTAEFTQSVGDPGRTICTLAQTWGADLVILGRRGRTGLSELVLGSVSNYVLHHAPCSVLTVQGEGTSVCAMTAA
jgi:nucleotide-binding universal stress UspA family protein